MLAWRKRVKGTVRPFRGAVAGCAQLLRVQLRGVVSTPQGVHLSDGWKRLKDLYDCEKCTACEACEEHVWAHGRWFGRE